MSTLDLSGVSLPAHASFAARLRRLVEADPDAPLIVCHDRRVSWAQFWEEVAGIARYLAGFTPPGACIAILAENRAEYVSAFIGAVVSGRCVVTLPLGLPASVLRTLVGDCQPAVLFASARYAEAAREVIGTATLARPCEAVIWPEPGSRQGVWLEITTGSPGDASEAIPSWVPPESPFNIIYSSGTTGTPKGIIHSHRTRMVMSQGLEALHFDRHAVALISTSLYTNLAIPATLGILWAGGRLVLMERFEPKGFFELAKRESATHFYLVPIQVQRLLEDSAFDASAVETSRLVYVGGSPFARELKERLMACWPGTLLEVYGMTEGAPVAALQLRDYPHKLGSVGRPVSGCDIRIIGEDGRAQPTGTIGEIVGRSGSMMLGYHNRPDANSELHWTDANGDAFFRSGDLGYLDEEGFLYVVDRNKDVIISGGLNIYASDLEAVVRTHPEVIESAVVGVASNRWGETPVACVVLREGATCKPSEIQEWVNERLAKYQRLAGVHCMAALPRNALGKVLKRELRATLRAVAA